jgi:hypothetical protein
VGRAKGKTHQKTAKKINCSRNIYWISQCILHAFKETNTTL